MSKEKQIYFCRGAIRHDGKRFNIGEKIELNDVDAEQLLYALAITKHDPSASANAEAEAKLKAEAEAKTDNKHGAKK